jgi:hypothetical protein
MAPERQPIKRAVGVACPVAKGILPELFFLEVVSVRRVNRLGYYQSRKEPIFPDGLTAILNRFKSSVS